MKRLRAMPALLAAALAAPALGAPEGEMGTLPKGTFRCELPGDAIGPISRRQDQDDFTIVTDSAYRVDGRLGSYLLIGKQVIMTSGAFKGRRYRMQSPYFLRLMLPDGSDGPLRCVRPRGRYR